MLDCENEGYGLNRYNKHIDDVQGRNALNTSIHEEFLQIKSKLKYHEI